MMADQDTGRLFVCRLQAAGLSTDHVSILHKIIFGCAAPADAARYSEIEGDEYVASTLEATIEVMEAIVAPHGGENCLRLIRARRALLAALSNS